MKKENVVIDLRDKDLNFMSLHIDNGEPVHKLFFDNIVIILNDEQMKRLES